MLICCALYSSGASAQFSDSVRHHILYSGTGMLNNTNDGNSYLLTNAIRFGMKYKRMEGNAASSWLYGEQRRQLTNNDFNNSIDFNVYSRLPHAYYWGLGTFEKSYSLKVNNRTQAGLGVAYNIIDRRDSLFLNISDGILYEYSNLDVGDTATDLYSTFRNSLRLRLRYRYSRFIVIEGTAFAQHSLSDGSDYIIRANASASLTLRPWLAFTTKLTYNKVSRTQRENLLLTFGLTLERWF